MNLNQTEDPYRNLLIHAVNQILERDLIKLDFDKSYKEMEKPSNQVLTSGFIETHLFDFKSVINWYGYEPYALRVSVWWKYDKHNHLLHEEDSFLGMQPRKGTQSFREIVGVTCSTEFNRYKNYLIGSKRDEIHTPYTRRGEFTNLKSLPKAIAKGYDAEGPWPRIVF